MASQAISPSSKDPRANTENKDSEAESVSLITPIPEANALENKTWEKSKKKNTQDEKWEEMFQRLSKFRSQKGHCHVPTNYAQDPKLAKWVAAQRRNHKTASDKTSFKLDERESRLLEIGFEWTAKNQRCVHWDSRFRQLLEFVVKYGHAQVPIGWEDNIPLSNWVSAQRQNFQVMQKGGKPSSLNQQRVDLLNCIGFVWKAQRGASVGALKKSQQDSSAPQGITTTSSDVYLVRARRLLRSIDNDTVRSMSNGNKTLHGNTSSGEMVHFPHQEAPSTTTNVVLGGNNGQHPRAVMSTDPGNTMGYNTQTTLVPTNQIKQLLMEQRSTSSNHAREAKNNSQPKNVAKVRDLITMPHLSAMPSNLQNILPLELLRRSMYQPASLFPIGSTFVPVTQEFVGPFSSEQVPTPQAGISSPHPLLNNIKFF